MLSHLVTPPKAKKNLLATPSSARFTRMANEMEWSTTSNVENIRGAFMPPPCLESNSSNSLHSFNYHDPYAGNSYTPTQIGRVISIPESENMYQCPRNNNNNEMMMMFKKKQRLTNRQLDSLEQSFQEDIKLDSNRKLKLAKELGLQPRQVAVWFQNRRARWKVKHLEESYDSIKQQYDVVSRENQMLHNEVKKLRGIILKDHLMKMQNNNQITGQYNNPMLVGSSLWPSISQPPYPW